MRKPPSTGRDGKSARVLITGASRGIGLEFVRQYANEGWHVIATCRNPKEAHELQAIGEGSVGKIDILALDMARGASIAALAKKMGGARIDVLINNAALKGVERGFRDEPDYQQWSDIMTVNCIAPIRLARALLASLKKSANPRIVNISSDMGSIAGNHGGGDYIYRSSKAALNMVSVSLARDLSSAGIIVLVLHPGWVATDMGGRWAPLKAWQSVRAMCDVIANAAMADSGHFLDYEKNPLPW